MAGARHRTERHRSHRLIAGLGVIALLLALLGGVADAAPGTISGTVTDEGGEPLADVIVTAYGASGGYGGSVIDQTDAEGVFQLTVGAGDHQLFFSRSGYVSEYYDDVTTGGTVIPVTVPSGGAVSGLVVDLALAGQVSGNLVLPPAEGPYAYYEGNVCAHPVPEGPGSYPMCTGLDAVGDYLFDSLAPGLRLPAAAAQLVPGGVRPRRRRGGRRGRWRHGHRHRRRGRALRPGDGDGHRPNRGTGVGQRVALRRR